MNFSFWRKKKPKVASSQDLTRPVLTMPTREGERVKAAYAAASVILEYGSGGSTVLAGDMPGKTVVSVESDKGWSEMIRQWFAENPPTQGTEVDVRWSDIGRTGKWARPRDFRQSHKFPYYPLGPWVGNDAIQPDVVLVDGRFRVGCVLATALYSKAPVPVYLDDYIEKRPGYKELEHWFGPPEMIGRMAHWIIAPMKLDLEDLPRIMELMLIPV